MHPGGKASAPKKSNCAVMSIQPMHLAWPAEQHLSGYVHALRQGWSPDNRRPEAAIEELARIAEDPASFLAEQVDRDAKGPPVILPDGSMVPRLPGYTQWIWDGEFCGSISFRWQPGTTKLPPYCLGHIGYSVVPWKRQRGYATRALQLLLPEARSEGLAFVELVADADNIASQRVIEMNGGILVERFYQSAGRDDPESLRFRILLAKDDGVQSRA
jgi:predicted acetyltransferase